jgi:TRAP-type C4-dicarboxylate transport system permease small subunit
MAHRLARLHARVIYASQALSWAAVLTLLLVCGAVLVDVALRWTLDRPIHGLEDMTSLVITVAVAACFPAGFALRSNITVRTLGEAIGPRTLYWLNAFGQAVTLAFVALLAWQLVVYAGDVANRRSLIIGLPIEPAWYAAAAFVTLAALVQALLLAVELAAAWSGAPIAPPRGGEGH